MKKAIIILSVFVLLLTAACGKQVADETTAKPYPETSTNKTSDELTVRYSDVTESVTNQAQSSTAKNQNVDIASNASNSNTENIQNSSPMIIFIGIDELKEIKEAYNSMPADDFQEYMEKEHIDTYMTGMWDYENSTALLEELCSTYMPVLDNNPNNLSEFGFYWNSNNIRQTVIFDGDKRASVIINTAKNTESKELQFDSGDVCLSQKDIKKDNYTAHIYEYENTDYRFYADVIIDDTYIVLRSNWVNTEEEFEEYFNRLAFVKIGDLISE